MNEEMKKETMREEDLEKVEGGGIGWQTYSEVPEGWELVTTKVRDKEGVKGVPLCPFDEKDMDYKGEYGVPSFADWYFYCSTCKTWFAKKSDGTWYMSKNAPKPKQ